jgi:hypothetical protein
MDVRAAVAFEAGKPPRYKPFSSRDRNTARSWYDHPHGFIQSVIEDHLAASRNRLITPSSS